MPQDRDVERIRTQPTRYGEWLELPLGLVQKFYDTVDGIPNAKARRTMQRYVALQDVFYLLTRVCGRVDMIHPWLYDRCRDVQKEPYGCLDIWARDHYKSTINTFGMTIQDMLADPETTIIIFSYSKDKARDFLGQIKTELEQNARLKALFPEVLYAEPQRQAPTWNQDELIVKRKTNPQQPTLTCSGLVDGQPIGGHWRLRKYDDVVVPESVTTPEQIKKTNYFLELSDNLGSAHGPSYEAYIGTFYHYADSYREMMKKGVIKVRLHPCTSDGSEDFSKSVLMKPEVLREKRKKQGPFTFGCQMLCNPSSDKVQGFQEAWLKTWPAKHTANLNIFILVDPASRKGKKNDYTAMWVLGQGTDGNYYVIDMIRDRLNLKERRMRLFDLVKDWQPHFVGYEETGFIADLESIEEQMERDNFRFDLIALPAVKKMSKQEKIRKLIPLFEAGRIYLPESCVKISYERVAVNLVQVFKEEEYLAFPNLPHDDMLDSLADIEHPLVKENLPIPYKRHATPEAMARSIQRRQVRGRRTWTSL